MDEQDKPCLGCEEIECQDCCQHGEWDHDMCLDCGYERCPGAEIDRAMDSIDEER